jgi:hypothetical protein
MRPLREKNLDGDGDWDRPGRDVLGDGLELEGVECVGGARGEGEARGLLIAAR